MTNIFSNNTKKWDLIYLRQTFVYTVSGILWENSKIEAIIGFLRNSNFINYYGFHILINNNEKVDE